MNWLAHAYLSKDNIEFRIGNILPDLVSITQLNTFPAIYQEGILCHRTIDRFTDTHPIVKMGIQRMPPEFKRYGGILTDVFYDHFLAKHWAEFSSVSLRDFSNQFYDDLALVGNELPADIVYRFRRLLEHRVFESYQDLAGIQIALQRIDGRLKRSANLGVTVSILEESYDFYEHNFFRFFADLRQHVQPYLVEK